MSRPTLNKPSRPFTSIRTAFRAFVVALCFAVPAASAHAAVQQPDGTVMPKTAPANEVSLQELFDFREGAGVINAVADSGTVPATFKPLCDFSAQFLLAETGARQAPVGWYNKPATDVGPTKVCDPATDKDSDGKACDGDEVYIILPGLTAGQNPPFGRAGKPLENPGLVFSGAQIAKHKHFLGGEIGFVLLGSEPHYSERRLNPICVPEANSCMAGERWIPTIMYESKKFPNAYYMGSEDQKVGPGRFGGNDGDFNDFVIFFSGLLCSGAGEDCNTGKQGICALGVTGCANAQGTSACKPRKQAGTESCNGLDDNCDGKVDEGDGICEAGRVCDRGVCVYKCSENEFPCGVIKACNSRGFCVEPQCLNVNCGEGETCDRGVCRGSCSGVVCPGDQKCLTGRCVDPCQGVTCGSKEVCSNGACIPECGCAGCPKGKACIAQTGKCGDPQCAAVTCATGTRCVAGACVDNCAGVTCPVGEMCSAGACVAVGMSSVDGGARDGGGVIADAASGDGGGLADASGSAGGTGEVTGCSCTLGRQGASPTPWWLLCFGVGGIALHRRRRRR